MSIEECIAEVKEFHPDANGITVDLPCDPIEGCTCFAEYDLEYITTYASCKFLDNDGNSNAALCWYLWRTIQATGSTEFEDGLRKGNHFEARNSLQRGHRCCGTSLLKF